MLLTPTEAASRLGIKPQTLAVWRCNGSPIKFVRVGRVIRYDPLELDRFVREQTCSNTAQLTAKR